MTVKEKCHASIASAIVRASTAFNNILISRSLDLASLGGMTLKGRGMTVKGRVMTVKGRVMTVKNQNIIVIFLPFGK